MLRFPWQQKRPTQTTARKGQDAAPAVPAPKKRLPLELVAVGVPRTPSTDGILASADPQTRGDGNYSEIGVSGLTVRNGKVYEDYNVDLMTLPERMSRFEEMRRSDTAVATIENLISLLIRRASWRVNPGKGDDSKRGQKIADRIQTNLMDEMSHSWDDFLRQALLGPLYGFSIFEQVWETKWDGMTGWRKFADRDRKTVDKWVFDSTGGLQGWMCKGYKLDDRSQTVNVEIPIEKTLLFTWREESGNPEGIGLLRQAWKAWSYKQAFEEFAAIRIERQALSIPVAKQPEDEDRPASELRDMAQTLARLRVNEDAGIVLPPGWELTFEWPGTADVPFEGLIERQHQYILQTMLAQFIGYSQGGDKGSFGLSADASSLFLHAIVALADWVCQCFNRYAISRWMEYNYPNHYPHPELTHGPIGMRDIGEWGNMIRALFDLQVLVPRKLLDHALQEAGMPGIDDEDWAQMEKMREQMRGGGTSDAEPAQGQADDTAGDGGDDTDGAADGS
jgi:hypothetical protein